MTDWTLDVTRLDAIVPPEGLQAEPGYEDQDPVTSHGFPEYRLRQLAEAATPGPWGFYIDDYGDDDRPGTMFVAQSTAPSSLEDFYASSIRRPQDAAYIAAVSPDVVLRLLDDLEAADRAVAALTPLVEAAPDPVGVFLADPHTVWELAVAHHHTACINRRLALHSCKYRAAHERTATETLTALREL